MFSKYYLDLGITAGKIQSAGEPPTDSLSGGARPSQAQALGNGDETPSTPAIKGSSASDGPGIIHCKLKKR